MSLDIGLSKKSICLYARSGQNKLYSKIGLKMEQDNMSVSYIVQNDYEEKNVLLEGCKGNVYNLTKYIKENWSNSEILDKLDLSKIELEYNINSIWSIFYTDRFLTKYKYDDAVKFIKLHILFYQNIIKIEKLDYYVNENIALFSSYIFYLIGNYENVKYLGMSCPRNFVDTKFYFTNDEHSTNYLLNKYLSENVFSDIEKDNANILIKSIRETTTRPAYMNFSGKKPKFKLSFFKDLAKYCASYITNHYKDFYNYETYKENKSIIQLLSNYIKYNFQKRYFQEAISNDIFFLFPLHFQPEATTLVNAQNYEKQLYAIDLIAKKLPIGTILYVKEHYAFLGHRESDFYKKLLKYPNVRLIDPWTDSKDLIKKSIGVITLTGTAGWEAMFYNKPVFLLGNMFYESFSYINKIKNIDDLSTKLKNIDISSYHSKEYEEELVSYVSSYLKSLKDGNYILGDFANVLKEENIVNITNNLIVEINRELNIVK